MARTSEEEIIKFLKEELSFQVTREMIVKPTEEFFQNVCVRILQEMDIDNLNQPDLTALDDLGPIEEMNKCIFVSNLFAQISGILTSMKITDFTQMDLLFPKPKKTMRIIYQLCYFLQNYLHLKNVYVQKVDEKYANIPQRKREIDAKMKGVQHEVQQKSMILSSLKSLSLDQNKELESLAEEHTKKKKESEELQEKSKENKQRKLAKFQEVTDLDLRINEALLEIDSLEQSIVRSPMKVINKTNDLKRELTACKEQNAELKAQFESVQKLHSSHEEHSAFLKSAHKEVKSLYIQLGDADEKCDDLNSLKDATLKQRERIENIQILLKQTLKSKQMMNEQIVKKEKQYLREKKVLVDLCDGFKKMLADKENEKQRYDEEQAELQSRLEDFEQRERNLDAQHAQELANLEEEFCLVLEKFIETS